MHIWKGELFMFSKRINNPKMFYSLKFYHVPQYCVAVCRLHSIARICDKSLLYKLKCGSRDIQLKSPVRKSARRDLCQRQWATTAL